MSELDQRDLEQAEGSNLFGLIRPTKVSSEAFSKHVTLMDLKESKFVLKQAILPLPKFIRTEVTQQKIAEIAIDLMKKYDLIDPEAFSDQEITEEDIENIRVPIEIVEKIKPILVDMRKYEVERYYNQFSEMSQHMQFEAERPTTATQMPIKESYENPLGPFV